jgi:ABC-2 type transport system ATP-binding protein
MEEDGEGIDMYSIELKNVFARIETFKLKDINLSIPRGSIVGLLGKNGAGKTTLFKTLMGTHLKYDGHMFINGFTYESNEKEIRESIAIVHDTMNVNPFTKGKRLYKYNKMMYPDFDDQYFLSLCDELNIPLDKKMNKMSLGMQKKLSIAIALSLKPNILLLDEPFIGIDPIDKQKLMKHIQAFMEDENRTILISSHYVEDVEKISDYIAIIDNGEIKLFQDKDTILDEFAYVKLNDDQESRQHIMYSKHTSFGVEGLMKKEQAINNNIPHHRPTLEEIFIIMSERGDA